MILVGQAVGKCHTYWFAEDMESAMRTIIDVIETWGEEYDPKEWESKHDFILDFCAGADDISFNMCPLEDVSLRAPNNTWRG